MIKLLKKLHIVHSWTPWKDGNKYEVTEGIYRDGVRYVTNTTHVLNQESRCETCNILRVREVNL